MSRFLLDTNIVSAVINDRVHERIAKAGFDKVRTSVIVLLLIVARASEPFRRTHISS